MMTLSPLKPSRPALCTVERHVLTQAISPKVAQTFQPAIGSRCSCTAKTKTGGIENRGGGITHSSPVFADSNPMSSVGGQSEYMQLRASRNHSMVYA